MATSIKPGNSPILISAPQWPNRPCNAPTQPYRVGKMPSVKACLVIYSHIVDASGQCMSVSLILGFKLVSVLVPFGVVFVNPVTFNNCINKQLHSQLLYIMVRCLFQNYYTQSVDPKNKNRLNFCCGTKINPIFITQKSRWGLFYRSD